MDLCVYCGRWATDRDHLRAVSLHLPKRPRVNKRSTVPACKRCNNALGASPADTIITRAEWLYTFHKKKFNLEDIKYLQQVVDGDIFYV